MAEIMLAFERGEQIEFMSKGLRNSAVWTTMTQEPEWNWSDFDYRVNQLIDHIRTQQNFWLHKKNTE